MRGRGGAGGGGVAVGREKGSRHASASLEF